MTKYIIDGETINKIVNSLNVAKIGYPINKKAIQNILNELNNLPIFKKGND